GGVEERRRDGKVRGQRELPLGRGRRPRGKEQRQREHTGHDVSGALPHLSTWGAPKWPPTPPIARTRPGTAVARLGIATGCLIDSSPPPGSGVQDDFQRIARALLEHVD